MTATDFDPRKLIGALLSQGVSPEAVAKQLGLSLSDVQKYVGANKPRPQAQAKNAPGKRKVPDFKWTTDNEYILKSMWAQGHSSGEIAQNLGTTTDSVDKKVKRLIGGGWDGRDPTKKFASTRSTATPTKNPPAAGSLSGQVRNVIAGNGQSPGRSKSFGQFAKRYIASGAAKSLEANFGLLGAWAASKLMDEQGEGKLAARSTGKARTERASSSSVVTAIDNQAKLMTSGLNKLGGTIARGTNMIARSLSLSGEKMTAALDDIKDGLRRVEGGAGEGIDASAIAKSPAAGDVKALGLAGILGAAGLAALGSVFGSKTADAKPTPEPVDPKHAPGGIGDGPPDGTPGPDDASNSEIKVDSKTLTFKADEIEFKAPVIDFGQGPGKAGGGGGGNGDVADPESPGGPPGPPGPSQEGQAPTPGPSQPETMGGPSQSADGSSPAPATPDSSGASAGGSSSPVSTPFANIGGLSNIAGGQPPIDPETRSSASAPTGSPSPAPSGSPSSGAPTATPFANIGGLSNIAGGQPPTNPQAAPSSPPTGTPPSAAAEQAQPTTSPIPTPTPRPGARPLTETPTPQVFQGSWGNRPLPAAPTSAFGNDPWKPGQTAASRQAEQWKKITSEPAAPSRFTTTPPPSSDPVSAPVPVQDPITSGSDLAKLSTDAAAATSQPAAPAAREAPPISFNDRAGGMFNTSDKDATPPATSKLDHAFTDQVPGINNQLTDPYIGQGE